MNVQLSMDGRTIKQVIANVARPPDFVNASGAPNVEHGYNLQEVGAWVEELAGEGSHRLDFDAFLEPDPAANSSTTPLHGSPICFVDGNATCSGAECRALVPPPAPPRPHSSAEHPAVWYSPHFDFMGGVTPPPDFFPLLNQPGTAWPELAGRTSTFKLKMSALFPAVESADLNALVSTVRARGMRVGLEIGGARWSDTTACQCLFWLGLRSRFGRCGAGAPAAATPHRCCCTPSRSRNRPEGGSTSAAVLTQ